MGHWKEFWSAEILAASVDGGTLEEEARLVTQQRHDTEARAELAEKRLNEETERSKVCISCHGASHDHFPLICQVEKRLRPLAHFRDYLRLSKSRSWRFETHSSA